ncbi:MAG TPA: hypothetical protein VFW33_11760, partial [Gemmataceae bacterium]|nr:hypothetical protein [Gemmataceae bacterium]
MTWRPPTGRLVPALAWGAAALLLWGRFLVQPSYVATRNLDESWAQAMAHFYQTGAQAGEDYVFPYGPLGYFVTGAYDPALFWQRYAWEVVVKLAAVVLVLRALAAVPSWPVRLLGAAVLFVFAPFHQDGVYQVAILACGVLMAGAARQGRGWLVVETAFLAALALTKFNAFLTAAYVVLV